MKIIAIVQARMGSRRFPGKVLKKINGTPVIDLLLDRLNQVKNIDKIVIATTTSKGDDKLEDHLKSKGFDVFRGSENDVLSRFFEANKKYNYDYIIRITGDCPLIDKSLIEEGIQKFKDSKVDYLNNYSIPTFPDGLDFSIFSKQSLVFAYKNAKDDYDKEHVDTFIQKHKNFSTFTLRNKEDLSSQRWTLDEPDDFLVISNIFNYFHPNIYFGWEEIIKLSNDKPEFFKYNKNIKRNEGSIKNKENKLWKYASKVIPGGNMLFSKRPEIYLPKLWPTYFKKTKDCFVWDLDNQKYIDMLFAVGTNTLGYCNDEVDNAVKEAISEGIMSSLNCPEEVYLADKLISMHPWAKMARFARTGGEANAIAVRIARAYTGKDKIAFCGYHGWHDWYLASGISNEEALNSNLMPGLRLDGVPRNLVDTVYPFEYNNLEQLLNILKNNDIGAIKMEVIRNLKPNHQFLEKIREICDENKIVLIFDECTSGFRQTFGGIHKLFNVEPDIALFGKALGNGYAITAILGREKIMDAAQNSFISSTFWTERIGYVAALKTLEIMERDRTWEIITNIGNKIKLIWSELAKKHNLKIEIFGIPALIKFTFLYPDSIKYKTLFTQEMLKEGFLASNLIYVSICHTDDVLSKYSDAVERTFSTISQCEKGVYSIDKILTTDSCISDFKRLN